MVPGVERIFELPWEKIARIFGRHLLRQFDSVLVTALFKEDQLCSKVFDDPTAFAAGAFRHHDCDRISTSGPDHGKRDSRITAGAFENVGVLIEEPTRVGVCDYGAGEAVFDTATGVEKLAFSPDRSIFGFHAERNDRGVSNQIEKGCAAQHDRMLSN